MNDNTLPDGSVEQATDADKEPSAAEILLAQIDEVSEAVRASSSREADLIKLPAGLSFDQVANPTGIRELDADSSVYLRRADDLAENHMDMCAEFHQTMLALGKIKKDRKVTQLNLGRFDTNNPKQTDVHIIRHGWGDGLWLRVAVEIPLPYRQKAVRMGSALLLYGTNQGIPWALRYRGEKPEAQARIGHRPLMPDQAAYILRFLKRRRAALAAASLINAPTLEGIN